MKIQWHENISFSGTVSTGNFAFNPTTADSAVAECTFACFTNGVVVDGIKSDKNFTLAGEYEMADILMRGFEHVPDQEIIYKVTAESVTCAYFGAIKNMPESKLIKELGENVDVVIVNINEHFSAKKAKELIERVEPRFAIVGGDPAFFAELKSLMNVTLFEKNSYTIPKANMMDSGTAVMILATE